MDNTTFPLRLSGTGDFDNPEAEVIAEMRRAAQNTREGVLTGASVFGGLFAPKTAPPPLAGKSADAIGREAGLILSALDAAGGTQYPRLRHLSPTGGRRGERCDYRVRGSLILAADGPDAEPWTIFTRDVTGDAVGFVAPDRLPLGYGGTLTLDAPSGKALTASVLLTRCRQCVGGWFEGALHFTRLQSAFTATD